MRCLQFQHLETLFRRFPRTCLFTWVQAVAGDVGSLQPLGELVGEEHVAQLTVAVRGEELPAVFAGAQVFVHLQSLNTTHINKFMNTASPE